MQIHIGWGKHWGTGGLSHCLKKVIDLSHDYTASDTVQGAVNTPNRQQIVASLLESPASYKGDEDGVTGPGLSLAQPQLFQIFGE